MKKVTLILFAIALFLSANNNANSQSVAMGDVQLRAYYGYPYFVGSIVKSVIKDDSAAVDINIKNTNHLGASIQFMVSDKVGLGIDYTFARVSATYIENLNRYKLALTKHRITALMSFHFSNSESVDPYFNVGAGYKLNVISYTEPGYDDSGLVQNAIPVSMRIGIGMNYFFTEAIGVNAEVGLGGPLAQIGLTFKF